MTDVGNTKGVAGLTSEEMRLKNYRAQIERHHEAEVQDLNSKHEEEIRRVMEQNNFQTERLKHDYDVQISEEAARMEDAVSNIRSENDKRIQKEKVQGQEELDHVKSVQQQQIQQYQKNSQEVITKLRHELEQSQANLRAQALKSARKQEMLKS